MGKPSSPSFRSGAPPISVYYYNVPKTLADLLCPSVPSVPGAASLI